MLLVSQLVFHIWNCAWKDFWKFKTKHFWIAPNRKNSFKMLQRPPLPLLCSSTHLPQLFHWKLFHVILPVSSESLDVAHFKYIHSRCLSTPAYSSLGKASHISSSGANSGSFNIFTACLNPLQLGTSQQMSGNEHGNKNALQIRKGIASYLVFIVLARCTQNSKIIYFF